MANDKDKTEPTKRNLASNANANPNPEDYSNKANIQGAVDTGKDGTKPTASQQQGQGAKNKNSGSGQGEQDGGSPTGK